MILFIFYHRRSFFYRLFFTRSIFSAKEEGFVSEDEETLKALKFLSGHFSKNNIRAFDRGYDNNRYYEYLIKHTEKFVIRAKKNRDVIYKGERINIMELAHKFKGNFARKTVLMQTAKYQSYL